MRVLVACEYSGRVRDAFIARGHDAISCDLLPTDSPGPHYQGDVFDLINWPRLKRFDLDDGYGRTKAWFPSGSPGNELGFDLMIAHPPCTRLANSGVRWLDERDLWDEMRQAAEFYLRLRNCEIPKKCIENPIMHKYAREILGNVARQVIQPWWFGEKTFKATGYELHGLPCLSPTDKLNPPKHGTDEHKEWSWVHRCPPGPNRWKIRSTTPMGIANAMAQQWGNLP